MRKFGRHTPLLSKIGDQFRVKRIGQLIRVMEIRQRTTILDVGGDEEFWEGFPIKCKIVCLNIYSDKPSTINASSIERVQYDGGRFPFDDRSFDIVHSNSVIEHVGSWNAQRRFASEIARVGNSYWVQTPNYFFPFEVHSLVPFFQFLPPNMKHYIAFSKKVRWSLPHDLLDLQLLTMRQMKTLFPEAILLREILWGDKIDLCSA